MVLVTLLVIAAGLVKTRIEPRSFGPVLDSPILFITVKVRVGLVQTNNHPW
ncbi:hypothetical protein HanRHA438_Chr02g0082021 [Helianthus annuus]|nr:hypothetical protein HanRHA438_Chr02g0082021 [Helianthus annuus]